MQNLMILIAGLLILFLAFGCKEKTNSNTATEPEEMPAKIEVPMKNCGGVSLIPGTKLFDFEACSREDVFVPGLVLEEMQMMTQIANVSFDPNVRPHLEPRWS